MGLSAGAIRDNSRKVCESFRIARLACGQFPACWLKASFGMDDSDDRLPVPDSEDPAAAAVPESSAAADSSETNSVDQPGEQIHVDEAERPAEMSDAESLLQRAIAGDADALGPLLDRYRPLLRARARESLPPQVLARIDESDVVQQTCLLVVRQLDQLRGRTVSEFVAWLLQVHQHNLLNMVEYHRGAARRRIAREQPGAEAAVAHLPGRLTSPSQKAVRGERRRLLEDCISRLPNSQSDAVRMRFLEEASLAEIAERMGRSEEAVAGLLKRGMAHLKRLLRDRSED